MYHSRKTFKLYRSRKHKSGCPFCELEDERLIRESEHVRIVPNLTFYDFWEQRRVIDHLLLIPRRHVETLADLNDQEKIDIMNLIAEYEAQGYDVFARSPGSATKSVPHQHTHLIKTTRKKPRLFISVERPYWVFKI